jgi:hypothetical protein
VEVDIVLDIDPTKTGQAEGISSISAREKKYAPVKIL